jgi:putative peptidoglycan lipid II flippase
LAPSIRAASSALYDTEQTALALSCYAIGLAGYSALKVLNPAFYALHDARTPMFVSDLGISIPLGVVVLYGMCRVLKVAELELATRSILGRLLK